MTQPPKLTIKEQIISFMEGEYERKKKVDFTSQDVSNGLVGRSSVKLIGAYLTGLRRENTIINTGTVPGGNGRAVTFALVKVLEKETSPGEAGPALEAAFEETQSETTKEESQHVTNDNRKPRSGTAEYFAAKTADRAERLEGLATKAVSKLEEAAVAMHAATQAMSSGSKDTASEVEGVFLKALGEQFASVVEVCTSMQTAWDKHESRSLEVTKAIAKSLHEQSEFGQAVHARTADMLDELTNADNQQRTGYRNGFSDGWTAAIHKLREEIGEAKSDAVEKSIAAQKANGNSNPGAVTIHLSDILKKLSIV